MKNEPRKLSVGFLYDDTLDSSDGVAQYVKNLGAWLSAHGHQVSYLVGETKTQQWAGGKVYSLSKNLHLSWGGNRLSISLVPRLKLIKQVINNNHFDVIHVQVPYSPFMAQQIINRAKPNTAVIGTFHVFPANSLALFGSKLLKIVYGRSLRRFGRQISVSSAAQSYAKEAFGVTSIVLPNVVDASKFKTVEHRSNNSKKIVFLGRLVERKGCMYLLKAFNQLLQAIPNAHLAIAGDGPERPKLERYVKRQKLDKSVEFAGFIDEKDKPSLLASADIACFPSLYGESFGIVLIEAMAAGAGVVIGGNNPGYASVLGKDSKAVVDPHDTSAFAARLEEILSDQELAARLHEQQQERVKQYDINKVGGQLLEVYVQAIASRRQKT